MYCCCCVLHRFVERQHTFEIILGRQQIHVASWCGSFSNGTGGIARCGPFILFVLCLLSLSFCPRFLCPCVGGQWCMHQPPNALCMGPLFPFATVPQHTTVDSMSINVSAYGHEFQCVQRPFFPTLLQQLCQGQDSKITIIKNVRTRRTPTTFF